MTRLACYFAAALVALTASGCGVSTGCQLDSTGCNCYSALPNGVKCSEANNPGTICCADLTFPQQGICQCLSTVPTCTKSKTSDLCHCWVGNTASADTTVVSSCSPVGTQVCCLDTTDNSGYCTCNFATACSGSNKQVTTCAAQITSCGSKSSRVASCSQ